MISILDNTSPALPVTMISISSRTQVQQERFVQCRLCSNISSKLDRNADWPNKGAFILLVNLGDGGLACREDDSFLTRGN